MYFGHFCIICNGKGQQKSGAPRPSGGGSGKGKKNGDRDTVSDLVPFRAVVPSKQKPSLINEADFPPLVNGGTVHFSDGAG